VRAQVLALRGVRCAHVTRAGRLCSRRVAVLEDLVAAPLQVEVGRYCLQHLRKLCRRAG